MLEPAITQSKAHQMLITSKEPSNGQFVQQMKSGTRPVHFPSFL